MNLFKRAWWRLFGHLGKTLMLIGVFFVICTLVLSGFLIQSAAARATDDTKRRVGAVASMQLDIEALSRKGKMGKDASGNAPAMIGPEGDLRRVLVDKVCKSSVVLRCNYTTESAAFPTKQTKLYRTTQPRPGEAEDYFMVKGIRDLQQVSAFRNGDAKLVAGRGIAANGRSDEIVIEERMAKSNKVQVGGLLHLLVGNVPPPGEKPDTTVYKFKVVGIYRSGTADVPNTPAPMSPANLMYTTPDGATTLVGKGGGKDAGIVNQASFTLGDPEDLAPLKKAAEAAGLDSEIFPLSVNDKQYRTLVGPINKTAGFATVTVWLVALGGTVILALIVASSLRERRSELGILLALGERKPRVLGQHLTEIVVCAVLAIGLAGACSQFLSRSVGDQLLASEVSSAQEDARNQGSGQSGTLPNGGFAPEESESEQEVKPIDSMDVRLGASDIAKVGATGLGIAALATLIPGARVLRLNPRDILAKGQ
ncbi:ABC transporter permease [Streptomyces sp. NPDC055078]